MIDPSKKREPASQETARPRSRMNSTASEVSTAQSTCIELDKELRKLDVPSNPGPKNGSIDQHVSAARWLDGQSSDVADCRDSEPDQPRGESVEVQPQQKTGRRFDKTSAQRTQRQQGENRGKNVPPPHMMSKDATMMGGPMGMMGNPMMGGPNAMIPGPSSAQMMWMMMMASQQQQMMANMQQWDAWSKMQSGMVPGGPPGYFNKGA